MMMAMMIGHGDDDNNGVVPSRMSSPSPLVSPDEHFRETPSTVGAHAENAVKMETGYGPPDQLEPPA